MTAATREAQAEPIVIYATRGFDNYTFALAIGSRKQLERHLRGQVVPTSRVTVAMDTRASFEAAFGPVEPQVVVLLTGLSVDRLHALGWQVEVRDSETDRRLWVPAAQAA